LPLPTPLGQPHPKEEGTLFFNIGRRAEFIDKNPFLSLHDICREGK